MSLIKSLLMSLVVGFSLTACASTEGNQEKSALANQYVGEIQASDLQKQFTIFDKNYQAFTLTDDQKTIIKTWPATLRVDIYFGTWCHDSQREVPKLLKALSYNEQVTSHLYSLDTSKQDPEGKAQAAGIKYTPTMVVYLNDKEVGRIIENPKTDWVTDINDLVIN